MYQAPGPQLTLQQRFNDTVGTLTIFRSDAAKSVLNVYRQFAVPLTRLMDYMWRSLSTGVTLLNKEAGQLIVDHLYTGPRMFDILQLDQLKTLPYLDKVTQLKARNFENLGDLKMGKFIKRLTRHDFGDNLKAFSDLFTSDGEELMARRPDGAWVYQTQALRPEDPLAQHIHYTLGFKSHIDDIALKYPYSDRRLPYLPDATREETQQAVKQVRGTLSLLDDLHLAQFMNRGRMVFDDIANGRYSLREGIDHKRLNKDLTRLSNPTEKKALTSVQQVAELLTSKAMLKATLPNANDKAAKTRLGDFIHNTFVESYSAEDNPRAFLHNLITQLETGTLDFKGKPVPLNFSAGRKWLGMVEGGSIDTALDNLMPQLEAFDSLLTTVQTQVNPLTAATELRQVGHEALAKFDNTLLTMAKQFMHIKHDHHGTLAQVLEGGQTSPLYKLVSDGMRSDMKCAALKLTSNAARMPSIALGVIPSIAVGGFLWSYLDNNVIQPYQRGVVAEKGDVRGATFTMGAGLAAGFITYRKMMGNPRVNFLMGNREPLQFWAAASASTLMATFTAVGLTKLFMKLKPDVYTQPSGLVATPASPVAPIVQPLAALTAPSVKQPQLPYVYSTTPQWATTHPYPSVASYPRV